MAGHRTQKDPAHHDDAEQKQQLDPGKPPGTKYGNEPYVAGIFGQIGLDGMKHAHVFTPAQEGQQSHHDKKEPVPFVNDEYRQASAYDTCNDSFSQHCLFTFLISSRQTGVPGPGKIRWLL